MITMLMALIAAHYIADYALQNAYVASAKADALTNWAGFHALTAHAIHHAALAGLVVFLLGGPWGWAAVAVGVTHWLIDYGKAGCGLYGIGADQAMHLTVIAVLVLLIA